VVFEVLYAERSATTARAVSDDETLIVIDHLKCRQHFGRGYFLEEERRNEGAMREYVPKKSWRAGIRSGKVLFPINPLCLATITSGP